MKELQPTWETVAKAIELARYVYPIDFANTGVTGYAPMPDEEIIEKLKKEIEENESARTTT